MKSDAVHVAVARFASFIAQDLNGRRSIGGLVGRMPRMGNDVLEIGIVLPDIGRHSHDNVRARQALAIAAREALGGITANRFIVAEVGDVHAVNVLSDDDIVAEATCG